jgi:hypothetical protein
MTRTTVPAAVAGRPSDSARRSGVLSPAWAGEGTGRIQPAGAGLQFHPHGEHRGRREPPQSGVMEAAFRRSPFLVTPEDTPSRTGGLSCERPGNGDRSSRSDSRQMLRAGASPHDLETQPQSLKRRLFLGLEVLGEEFHRAPVIIEEVLALGETMSFIVVDDVFIRLLQ